MSVRRSLRVNPTANYMTIFKFLVTNKLAEEYSGDRGHGRRTWQVNMSKLRKNRKGMYYCKHFLGPLLPLHLKRQGLKLKSIELQAQAPGSRAQPFHQDHPDAGDDYYTIIISCTDHKSTEYPFKPNDTAVKSTVSGWSTQIIQQQGRGAVSGHSGSEVHRGPANDSDSWRFFIALVFAKDGVVDPNEG